MGTSVRVSVTSVDARLPLDASSPTSVRETDEVAIAEGTKKWAGVFRVLYIHTGENNFTGTCVQHFLTPPPSFFAMGVTTSTGISGDGRPCNQEELDVDDLEISMKALGIGTEAPASAGTGEPVCPVPPHSPVSMLASMCMTLDISDHRGGSDGAATVRLGHDDDDHWDRYRGMLPAADISVHTAHGRVFIRLVPTTPFVVSPGETTWSKQPERAVEISMSPAQFNALVTFLRRSRAPSRDVPDCKLDYGEDEDDESEDSDEERVVDDIVVTVAAGVSVECAMSWYTHRSATLDRLPFDGEIRWMTRRITDLLFVDARLLFSTEYLAARLAVIDPEPVIRAWCNSPKPVPLFTTGFRNLISVRMSRDKAHPGCTVGFLPCVAVQLDAEESLRVRELKEAIVSVCERAYDAYVQGTQSHELISADPPAESLKSIKDVRSLDVHGALRTFAGTRLLDSREVINIKFVRGTQMPERARRIIYACIGLIRPDHTGCGEVLMQAVGKRLVGTKPGFPAVVPDGQRVIKSLKIVITGTT